MLTCFLISSALLSKMLPGGMMRMRMAPLIVVAFGAHLATGGRFSVMCDNVCVIVSLVGVI